MRKFIFLLVCVVLSGASLTSAQNEGKLYVLVHGAFQDASGWNAVIPSLEAAGNTVMTVQLAGRGDDETPLGDITLDDYRDQVVEVIEAQDTPVILVGHSFGGMVISAVAEAIPDKIERLVYLAAYLPQSGDSLTTLAGNDHYSVLGKEGNFGLAEDFTYAYVKQEIFATAFCPDCTEDQLKTVEESQLNEPLVPLNTSVTVTEDKFGSVYKVYILTAQDVVVSPQLQAYMLSNTPADRVFALNTGHAPYVSQPENLAKILIQAAQD